LTPEARRYLDKATKSLEEGRAVAEIGLGDPAGRAAYLAAFHAAQAVVFERTGRTAKSHKGLQAQFLKIAMAESAIDDELRKFLSRAYNMKAIADYETGPGSEIPLDRAKQALVTAARFVETVTAVLG
jgi:uncharacterized protein (UPF0332 family)